MTALKKGLKMVLHRLAMPNIFTGALVFALSCLGWQAWTEAVILVADNSLDYLPAVWEQLRGGQWVFL